MALAASVPGTVRGAPDAFAANSELEEIVVTASRTRQRVFDSPASLSVINEAELARATVPSLAELMRDVPGVQVTDSGQPGLGRIRIRGEESRRKRGDSGLEPRRGLRMLATALALSKFSRVAFASLPVSCLRRVHGSILSSHCGFMPNARSHRTMKPYLSMN